MSDQHRGDCLDFTTQADGTQLHVQTPHLRRLASEGVYFPNFYSKSPVCIPARAMLQTGQLPHRSGISGNGSVLPETAPTLAGCLSANGYYTQGIGKMHFRPVRTAHGLQGMWLSEEIPYHLEEDDFLQFLVAAGYGHVEEPNGNRHELYMQPQVSQLPETHHTTACTGRKTVEFLREHTRERGEQPFFCWTSFQKPHPPFEPPVPWHRMYQPTMAPAVAKSERELAWLAGSTLKGWQAVSHFPDPDRLAALWTFYYSAISFVNSWIGMILDELERLDLRENTLVIYTSDHGEMMGDHWCAGKSTFFEGSTRVPGIVSWPARLPQGVVRNQLAGLADIVPSILEAAGIAPEASGLEPDGVSLIGPARDDALTREVLLGLVAGGQQTHLMALDAEWKYMYVPADNRELLFRYRGEGAELENYLHEADDEITRAAAKHLRAVLQERLWRDGATELLDESSPNGYRLFPVPSRPKRVESGPVSHFWLRASQYARWIQDLPEGWIPPPATPAGDIPADLPLRSDRSRYAWAVMQPA